MINGSIVPGRGINFGINKDIPSDESSRIGYNLDVELGMDNLAIAPTINYKVNDNIQFSGALSADLQGALSQTVSFTYGFGGGKRATVEF